jgi:outer membrane protein
MTQLRLALAVAMLATVGVARPVEAQTAATAATAPAGPVKVGVLDMQRALNSCAEGKRAKERLEADFRRRQQDIDRSKTELESFARDLENSEAMLTPEAKQQRMQEYQRRFQELQERFERSQRELAEAEQAATADIMRRLVQLANRLAQEKGLTVVVEKAAVVFATDGLDFTDELVRRFDAGQP